MLLQFTVDLNNIEQSEFHENEIICSMKYDDLNMSTDNTESSIVSDIISIPVVFENEDEHSEKK